MEEETLRNAKVGEANEMQLGPSVANLGVVAADRQQLKPTFLTFAVTHQVGVRQT